MADARNRMAPEQERLSIKEKVGYGIGDAAANFIFQTMIIFRLAFDTDTFGITAAAAGTLFLVVRGPARFRVRDLWRSDKRSAI